MANVGDSRAIVGKVSNGELKVTALSTDQTPYRKDERERVRSAGGEIMARAAPTAAPAAALATALAA